MGSKSQIAEKIVDFLPSGKRFVDLFGGGGAMSHCASLSGKYEQVLYNELNPIIAKLFNDAINGKYSKENFLPRWISREEFNAKKDVDGYIATSWSFGGSNKAYLFHKEIEEYKRQGFEYCVNCADIDGLPKCESTDWNERRKFLNRWAKSEFDKNIKGNKEAFNRFQSILFGTSKIYRELVKFYALKFTAWLRPTGITGKEVNELTNSQMSSHFLSKGTQPAIPTAEQFDKLKQSPKLANVPDWINELVYNDDFFIENEKAKLKKEELSKLQRLQRLESLQRLQSLESLQRLQSL